MVSYRFLFGKYDSQHFNISRPNTIWSGWIFGITLKIDLFDPIYDPIRIGNKFEDP